MTPKYAKALSAHDAAIHTYQKSRERPNVTPEQLAAASKRYWAESAEYEKAAAVRMREIEREYANADLT